MRKNRKSLLLFVTVLLIGLFSQSLGPIFTKLADDVPSTMIAMYRMLYSSLILIGVWIFRRQPFPVSSISKREIGLCVLSGIFVAVHFITWIQSLQFTTVASSVMIVNMNAIFVGILAYFIFAETVNVIQAVGISFIFFALFLALKKGQS